MFGAENNIPKRLHALIYNWSLQIFRGRRDQCSTPCLQIWSFKSHPRQKAWEPRRKYLPFSTWLCLRNWSLNSRSHIVYLVLLSLNTTRLELCYVTVCSSLGWIFSSWHFCGSLSWFWLVFSVLVTSINLFSLVILGSSSPLSAAFTRLGNWFPSQKCI